MQFIAARDIGALVARIFGDPTAHAGRTIDLAGDQLTGTAVAEKIGRATGTAIPYSRFPEEVLAQSPLLRRIVDLVDEGGIVGNADVPALRQLWSGLLTFDAWLAGGGAAAVRALSAP